MNDLSNSPVGVLDIGPGGLAVAKELRHLMPGEEIIFCGDMEILPEAPTAFVQNKLLHCLKDQKIKALICVSGLLDNADRETMGVPVLDLVHSGARAACGLSAMGKIGVIAGTDIIRSGLYPKAIHAIQAGAKVFGNAAPLLADLAEGGMHSISLPQTRKALEEYLAPLVRERIDTLLVGSAAFAPLYDSIGELLRYRVTLVDPCAAVARDLQAALCEEGTLSSKTAAKEVRCLAGRIESAFQAHVKVYWGEEAPCRWEPLPNDV